MGPVPQATHGGSTLSSGIAARTNPERTNRWLLIGAVALAVVAGILVFAALANFGGDDATTAVAGPGDIEVLVATQTINAGTLITADMFETRTVASTADLVPGAISDQTQAVGQVARDSILANSQLSTRHFAISGTGDDQFSVTVPPGKRAQTISVGEITSVAGLVVPGDRVDLIVTYTLPGTGDQEIIRVEPLLQDVELLAFAQTTLEAVAPGATDDPAEVVPGDALGNTGRQPSDLSPNPGAGSATLALTPEQVLQVVAAQRMGSISLSLRHPGDRDAIDVSPIFSGPAGLVPPIPPPLPAD
jgi:pilus assembly protein CpaB